MIERRARLLVNGELVPGLVRAEGARIASVEPEPPDAPGSPASTLPILAPGLIDLHIHGFAGAEPLANLGAMATALARAGTTAFLPTLFPREPAALGEDAAGVWREAARLAASEGRGAVLGVHLEGPFVSPAAAGALDKESFADPSPEALRSILGPATGDGRGIRIVTLAPELPGAGGLIEELAKSGVRVSLGHSRATAAEARAAARAGATGATHLFNAMGPLHHREVGLAGFALSDDALVAEIIGDRVHVGADAFALALRARGPLGLALVSDALHGAGTGCAVFESHGHRCRIEGGAAWIEDPATGRADRLAGAALCQLEAVRGLVRDGVVSAAEALVMASEAPARALGLEHERGRLAPGAYADWIVLEGPELRLVEVVVGGTPLSSSEPAR